MPGDAGRVGVRPFLQIGAGAIQRDLSVWELTASSTSVAFNGALGVDVGFAPGVGLRLMAKDNVGKFDFQEAVFLDYDGDTMHNVSLAAGLEVPRQLFVHGYLLMDERKMSKSLGNVIDPLDLIDVYGVDALRFYLFRVATFGQDGSISVDGIHERYERELGNDLGNLLSRTTAMLARYREGRLRPATVRPELADELDRLRQEMEARLDVFDLTGSLELAWEVVRRLNRHVEQTAPWELAKDDGRAEELDQVLYELADGLRALAVALAAFVPETSERILAALGQPLELGWEGVAPGRATAAEGIEPAAPLFPRVPYVTDEAMRSALSVTDHPKAASTDPKTLYDNRFLQELESSGFVRELYGSK